MAPGFPTNPILNGQVVIRGSDARRVNFSFNHQVGMLRDATDKLHSIQDRQQIVSFIISYVPGFFLEVVEVDFRGIEGIAAA